MVKAVRPARDEALDAHVTRLALDAAAGDRPALGEFIRLTQPDVTRFLRHLAGDALVDDLAQDTYLRAMDALPAFEGRSSARTWLLTIARRVVADQVRRDMARPQTPRGPSWITEHGRSTSDPSLRVELDQLLASLEPGRREAFVLTQVLGYDYQQAADVCGVRIGTIRSRVSRARADLVATLAPATAEAPLAQPGMDRAV